MADLISRAAAIEAATDWKVKPDGEIFNAIKAACRSKIEQISAVDAVPVVRCEKCWKRGLDNCPMEFYWDNHPADDLCYCAMGERREAQPDG